ncbi:hypothetical protein GCM10027051_25510 [Niabella terrae]
MTRAQDLSFLHLNRNQGLTNNRANSVLTDNNGVLWVGTVHGLNSYDGNRVINYYRRDYPGLASDGIVRMVCDTKNRIWIQCGTGRLSLLDANRQFHEIIIWEKGNKVPVDYLLPLKEKIMFLSKGRLYQLFETDSLCFSQVQAPVNPLLQHLFKRINPWDKNRLVFSGDNLLFLWDSKTLKTTKPMSVPLITAAVKYGEDTALITTAGINSLCLINLRSGQLIEDYSGVKDQYGEQLHKSPRSIYHLTDSKFILSSATAGVYIFDAATKTLRRYRHNPIDPHTIASNSTAYIFADSRGFFFITTHVSGLDYFRINSNKVHVKPAFQDKITGRIYDGYIAGIAEDSKGNFWMAGPNILIAWNRHTDETTFHYPKTQGQIRTLSVDQQDRIWLGSSKGVSVYDAGLKLVKRPSAADGFALKDDVINNISIAPDGRIWLCTSNGIRFMDPRSFKVRFPEAGSILNTVNRKNCTTLFFGADSVVWIGTWEGAYKLDTALGAVSAYSVQNGLLHNHIIGFATDHLNNFYIATRLGFHILGPGTGLLAQKSIHNNWPIDCYSMLKDQLGNIWLANRDYLATYLPASQKFKVYDSRSGINSSGFYFFSALTAREGTLVFGSNQGISYFKPQNIRIPDLPLTVLIQGMETAGRFFPIARGRETEIPFRTNSVNFSFSAVNLLKSDPVYYQYMLEGADRNWIKTTSSQQVNYNGLAPGKYRFRVKASSDNQHWTEASLPMAFSIKAPWWQNLWFIMASSLLGLIVVGIFIRQRNRKTHRRQEQLETERAINYLSSSLHEQKTVDDILWDVAKNCIGRLNFEDCVIYLTDESRNVLVQKAAWGPKSEEGKRIIAPLEIPVGEGIVGSVAQHGKPEIIGDTTRDKRYIVDDERRLSEIAVPIIYKQKVLGVIDSEHSRKNFFTGRQLSILSTVASVCAQKITRLWAEEASRKAQFEILKQERKTIEAQLKSLRLQMNPHFLFNSLNAIQQLILSGEDTAATRYLSKFSRMLRLVLLHSDRETVTLKEELETLELYIALEALRFKESFGYRIQCDSNIDADEINIPAMLIQPFAENAIWHGLMHKKEDRLLQIYISEYGEDRLSCCIEDNGIGRNAAGKLNNVPHAGKGISVAEERLNTYNAHQELKSNVTIEDLKHTDGTPCGTRVTLILPLL